jgi:hypothetical protein
LILNELAVEVHNGPCAERSGEFQDRVLARQATSGREVDMHYVRPEAGKLKSDGRQDEWK